MSSKKKPFDLFFGVITFLCTAISIFIFFLISYYIFSKGFKLLNFDLIFGDSYQKVDIVSIFDNCLNKCPSNIKVKHKEEWFYSSKWGIALKDDFNKEDIKIIRVAYIDINSPFNNAHLDSKDDFFKAEIGLTVQKVIIDKKSVATVRDGAKKFINKIENGSSLRSFTFKSEGGGIRGSIVTTLYLIFLSLIFSIPFGIFAAIYLNEYAFNNLFTRIIRSLIDVLAGVPSILFGFVGAILFIPFVNKLTNTGNLHGSIYSGALTLTIMLLPNVIKSVEEALIFVPNHLRFASFALGASKVQTIFKVVVPNAMSGILTSVILSVSRIIGESSLLIFSVGTVIKDNIVLSERSTSLAVHIWASISGEVPNFELASVISLVIFIIVLILNLFVKFISKKINSYKI